MISIHIKRQEKPQLLSPLSRAMAYLVFFDAYYSIKIECENHDLPFKSKSLFFRQLIANFIVLGPHMAFDPFKSDMMLFHKR